ncbi:MAG: hypothetical protein LIO81_10070 [Clostridiales bacterium]|nr:hypothetical protein [Clostridiales bacterium]
MTSISRSSNTKLYVYITLGALDDDDDDDDDDKSSSSDYDLDVYGLEWLADGRASWDGGEDARKYEVRLYRGSTALTSAETTTNDYYNFSQYFTSSGTYTFRVRAVYNSSYKGDWETSEELYVTSTEAAEIRDSSSGTVTSGDSGSGPGVASDSGMTSTSSGAWLLDDVGWWYSRADRTYPASQWEYINNVWYYFNESGYMVVGWNLVNDVWYYMDESGAMLTDTTTPDGYQVGPDGAWIQ